VSATSEPSIWISRMGFREKGIQRTDREFPTVRSVFSTGSDTHGLMLYISSPLNDHFLRYQARLVLFLPNHHDRILSHPLPNHEKIPLLATTSHASLLLTSCLNRT